MTETERMAREAGCFTPGASRNYWAVTDPALARFAELVRAAERERCAKLLDDDADRQEAAWNAHLASGASGPATTLHSIPRAYAARIRGA